MAGSPDWRSIGTVSSISGLLLNWTAAFGALALGGPLYAIIVFLAIALVRVAIDAQALRRDNEHLAFLLAEHDRVFGLHDATADADAPPESTTRPSRAPLAPRAAVR